MGPVDGAVPAGSNAGVGLDNQDHSQLSGQCSYSNFVKEKFYEYVAMIEMIYLLATDESFRKKLISEISGSAAGDIARMAMENSIAKANQQNAMFERLLSLVGLGDEKKAEQFNTQAMEHFGKSSEHAREALPKIEKYFRGLWQEIKKRYYDCGWFYAASTTATDGVFFLGELALGAGIVGVSAKILRGLKFVTRRLPNGKIRAEVINETSGASVRKEFSEADLAAKYGTPEENHLGTSINDRNRQIPDEPAEGMAKKQGDKSKLVGAAAEKAGRDRLAGEGYKDIHALKNNSEHGIDLVGRNPETGAVKVVEVKANSAGPNTLQNMGGPKYSEMQVDRALSGDGHWNSMPEGMDKTAGEVRNWLRSASSKQYEIWKYDVDDAGNAVYRGKADWSWKEGEKPRRLIYRDDAGKPARKPKTETPPATGPPGSG